jgi:hypothetical protein
VHLWEKKTGNKNCPVGSQSLISSLTELSNSPRFNTLAPWPQSI